MKLHLTGLRNTNWFYISSIIFAISLPFSSAFISISAGLLIVISLVQLKRSEISATLNKRKELLFILGIYLVYLIGLFFTEDWKLASYDLRKNLAYLIVPISFIIAPSLSKTKFRTILYVFAGAVVLSSLLTFAEYYFGHDEETILSAQEYGFMHHIRFSLQINFAIFILVQLLYEKRKRLNSLLIVSVFAGLSILGSFLIWHQSLTGVLTLIGTSFIAIIIWVLNQPQRKTKLIASLILSALIILPSLYLYNAITRYYDIDEWNPEQLERVTEEGNIYTHNLNNKLVENGHYVWMYICEIEMKEVWNSRSELKYEDIDKFGYKVKDTLIRYLSSKNLRKDKAGVKALSDEDIRNIQNGIGNYILAGKGISLYPRIYVSIWELDIYLKTGNANHKSLAQRIEYTKAALEIIQENFWFGVGTGNWKAAYREVYINNKAQMAEARYGNVHNQYLNYMVKFGLIGLLVILFSLLYPVIKTRAYQDYLFLLFLVIMFIGNFGDANFETHTGSHFFVFFYCWFLIPKVST